MYQRKARILFLCTGNSCRSQMAEGWANHLGHEWLEAHSAGIEAHGKNPRAIADALSILIQDKKRAAEYGTALSADVKNRFSIERMVRETMAVYEKM